MGKNVTFSPPLSLSRLFTSHLFFVWPFLLPGWLNVRVLVGINKPEHYSAVKRHVVRTFSLYLNCLNETDKKAYGVFCVLYFHHSCVPHQETVSYFLSLFLHNFAYYSGQNVTVSLTCFFPQTFLTSFFFFLLEIFGWTSSNLSYLFDHPFCTEYFSHLFRDQLFSVR